MTYDQLVAFLAVAIHGSFTAASAALHKSQPAISKLVRNLEEEMGVELFDRAEYRATLTERGRLFRERASAVIESTEALRSFAATLAGRVEPVLRIAVEAVTPIRPVLDVLRDLEQRYPGVRIELATERLSGAAEALAIERTDIAVATMFGIDSTTVESARYACVRIVPVVHRDHPLAASSPPPLSLLRAHAQIVLSDTSASADAPSVNVLEGGLRWSVSDVAAKHEIIRAGMGWGGLPDHVVAAELASGELVALDVSAFSAGAMELFVHRRRDRPRGVAAQALWDALVSNAPPS